MLAGLLHVHGYTVTPSHPSLPLFSTTHSSHLPITAIDPHSVRSRHLQPMVDCLCKPVVKFVASGFNLEKTSSVVVCDDFDLDDIRWLNSLRGVAIACVCVVWNLDSPLVSCLQTIPRCGLPKAPPQTVSRNETSNYGLRHDGYCRSGLSLGMSYGVHLN